MDKFTSSDWVDLRQAVADYPISRRSYWNLIAGRRLAAYKPFGKILLRRSDIEALIASSRIGADLDKLVDETVRELGVGK